MAVERQVSPTDIESIISRLRDVIAVSVVPDSEGGLAEIHVLADSGRTPKQMVRDIESALMARLGYHVDHKIVSVAQVDRGSRTDGGRLKFADVSISLNGARAEAIVHLTKDGEIYSGTANASSSPAGQMKLIADATLQAVQNAGLSNVGFALEDVAEINVGGRRAAVVVVNVVGGRGDEILAGCALVRQDIWKGVVNATLDAVNRRLSAAHI